MSTMQMAKQNYGWNRQIELAQNYGLPQNALREVEAMVRKHEKEIRDGWQRHFSN